MFCIIERSVKIPQFYRWHFSLALNVYTHKHCFILTNTATKKAIFRGEFTIGLCRKEE